MILRYNPQLAELINAKGRRFGTFTNNLIEVFIAKELIDTEVDEEEYYTLPLYNCIKKTAKVEDVINAIKEAGIEQVTSEVYQALFTSIVIGEGDCPYCGSYRYYLIREDNRFEFHEYECRECENCGHYYEV